MRNVIVVIGAGSIGQAVARRVSAGKHVVLADLRQENADGAARHSERRRFRREHRRGRRVLARVRSTRLVEKATDIRRHHRPHSCRRCLPEPGLAADDSQGGPVWNRARARGIRKRHRARRRGRRDRVSVRAPASAALGRAEQSPRNDTGRRIASTPDAAARPRDRLPPRVPDFQNAGTRCA